MKRKLAQHEIERVSGGVTFANAMYSAAVSCRAIANPKTKLTISYNTSAVGSPSVLGNSLGSAGTGNNITFELTCEQVIATVKRMMESKENSSPDAGGRCIRSVRELAEISSALGINPSMGGPIKGGSGNVGVITIEPV